MPLAGAVTDPSRFTTERVAISVPGTTPIDAFVARPVGTRPRAAIIVIHEAFGPVEHIDDLARRFAHAGFDAVAPNLYTRVGTPDPTDMKSVMGAMFGVSDAQVVADLEATAAYVRALPHASGRVGCIGFCSGGRQTLLFACSSNKVDAAVDCWGGFIERAAPDADTTPSRPVKVLDLVPNLACPVLAVGAGDDQNPSPAVLSELVTRFASAKQQGSVTIYPGVQHAFLADYRPSYDESAAHKLWPQVIEFFGRHLA